MDADLFLFEDGCFYEGGLPPELTVHVLQRPPRICSFLPFETAEKLWHPDWSTYGYYDLAADFNSYQFACAAGALGVQAEKRVMWIHNNVEIKLENEWKYRVLWHFFKGKLHRFDGFVPCSPALKEPFRRLSGCRDAEYRVIANYIDISEIRRKQAEDPAVLPADGDAVNFVALGRLCHQKGYDIMIPSPCISSATGRTARHSLILQSVKPRGRFTCSASRAIPTPSWTGWTPFSPRPAMRASP